MNVFVTFAATAAILPPAQVRAVTPQEKLAVPAVLQQLRGKTIRPNLKPYSAIKLYPVKVGKIVIQPLSQPNVDLRPKIESLGIAVRNQGGRGTCSVHALAFLIEYMYRTRKGIATSNLSEEYLNHMTNVVINKYGDGDFFSNIALGFSAYGIVAERLLPYKPTYDPNQAISQTLKNAGKSQPKLEACFIKEWNVNNGASQAQIDAACESIKADIPVAAGLRWPRSGKWLTTVVYDLEVMIPPAAADVFDGHSIAFVGYKKNNAFPGGGYFIFRNHGGPDWWDKGYGYMSFAYVKQYCNDLMVYLP